MSANFPELISAYLDGEVTAEERAAVEQSLVEDAALRRLFYELRALRNQLARLPRYKLKADLSREVLRRAEKALLQPTHQPEAQASGEPADQAKVQPVRRPASWWQTAA